MESKKIVTMTLHGQARDGISLEAVLEEAAVCELFTDRAGLFYSPQACDIGYLRSDGTIEILRQKRGQWQPQTLALESVFEARMFCKTAELSWLNIQGESGGRVVLASEIKQPGVFEPIPPIENCVPLPQQYLVWGKYDEATETVPDDWSVVSTSQIGRLAVPVGWKKGATAAEGEQNFVVLKSREYVVADDDGNAYVRYERLLNFRWDKKTKEENKEND